MGETDKSSSRLESRTIEVVVIVVVLALAFMLFLPIITHRSGKRMTSPADTCINNLRQIDAAATLYGIEHRLTNGSPINFPTDLISYVKLDSSGKIPSCPSGGIYHISKVDEIPTCSLGSTVTPAHVLP